MSSQGNTITSGFIDLATFDEIEKYLYGGADATAYFVRETRKSTWFTQVPVTLSRAAGMPGFGQECSWSISRAGDYLLQSWLRVTVNSVELNPSQNTLSGVRWTRNFMHNLVRECSITFNDLVAARFDNYHLDFWAGFTVPAGKRNGYANMIGSFDAMVNSQQVIDEYTLNLPLPFFYGRDSGVALPTAALPYNEMRINFAFRDWSELLIGQNVLVPAGQDSRAVVNASQLLAVPELKNVQLWSNYAIVSNDERKRMACAPRDILIEQVQTAPKQPFLANSNRTPNYDIRFSHAIKVLFFAVRNNTFKSEWSQYITNSPIVGGGGIVTFVPDGSADPIENTSLIYENTQRLSHMGSDYFSLVNPYYHAPTIPTETGLHTYSYSLDFIQLDPMGSTNYGKLTNVSIMPEASSTATTASQGNGPSGFGADFPQSYEFHVTAVNNNIIRISGGALGFPVL